MLTAFRRMLTLTRLVLPASFTPCLSNQVSVFTFSKTSLPSDVLRKRCSFAKFSVKASDDVTSSQRSYQVVVAATRDLGIGRDGKLPWRLPSDMKFFKELTMSTSNPLKKNAVVMGRKTWESIPSSYRPLPGRLNVVLTRSMSFGAGTALTCQSMPSALQLLAKDPYASSIEKVFVIGGGQILRDMLNAPRCDAIHITEIETKIECDTFIPEIYFSCFQPWYSSPKLVENNVQYSFATYVRTKIPLVGSQANAPELENFQFLPKLILERHEECQFLRLLQDVMSAGNKKTEHQVRFNLCRTFPLLTTKNVPWRDVVNEVLKYTTTSSAKLSDVLDKIRDRAYIKKIDLPPWNSPHKKTAETFSQFFIVDGKLCCQLHLLMTHMSGMPEDSQQLRGLPSELSLH